MSEQELLLHAIVDRARRTFGAQACSILLHEPESRLLVFAAMSGEGAEALEGSESLVGVRVARFHSNCIRTVPFEPAPPL